MGTGTLDIIHRCRDAYLSEPVFNDSSGFKTKIWYRKPSDRMHVQPDKQNQHRYFTEEITIYD